MQFKKKTLKNGLRIVVVPIADAPSLTVMSMVETGSEYESKEKNGISHFLEHMFFKGTKNRTKSIDISKEFDGMGAINNAFTSNEVTAYYGKCSPQNFEKVLDIISDMYLNPTFPEVEMRREDFVNYRKAHYVAEKTMIVVAGDVNVADVFEKVENKFKTISTGKVLRKKKLIEKQNKPEIKIKHKDTDQAHLVVGVRTFSLHDKRMPILKVLSTILGNGMSSRLFQKMREELGICYYVHSGINDLSDHGNFYISAGVDKSRLSIAVNGVLEEIKKIKDEKISPLELKKAKDYLIGHMYLGLESSDSLAGFYGFQEIMREKIKTPKEEEKEILAVTSENIKKLASQIFVNKSLNMAIFGNIKDTKPLKKILHF